ncbi:hypothetical protein JMW54_00075 [Clostridioides difficile]|nr:hypothetical protein JMW54_00075 [Clostridioides difficile]
MRFEIGKTYKFDREKFIACNGIEHYKRCEELWIEDVEGVEFTVEKLLMMAMFVIQMNFSLILV